MRTPLTLISFPAITLTLLVVPSVASAQMEIATGAPETLEVGMASEQSSLPLTSEQISVTIDRQHASTTIKQTFHNRAREAVEGRYSLRAGAGTRVEGFAYWNGEQKIVGEVFEKEVARQIYEGVTQRRRDPGLLEESGDGAFSFQVFPIAPDEKKRVEIRYTKWLKRHGKSIRYRAPVASAAADIVVDILSERKVTDVRSSSHTISVDKLRGGGVRVRAARRGDAATFELSYAIDEPAWTVGAAVHKDPAHDGYFAVSLAAPTNLENKVAAKDVTIVLDRSGSMAGEPLSQAKAAAADIIARLDGEDRVNVVAFDDDVDPLFDEPVAVTKVNRARAIGYVEGISTGGGTDLALALSAAFAAQADSRRPKVILFLTDGQSDVSKAIAAAEADTRDVRVFAVGLGTEVNQPLLSRLARLKRGQVATIVEASEIERQIGLIYSQISRPLLVNVSFDVLGAATDRRVYPRTIPDLFIDDELLITGRLRGEPGRVTFLVRGELDGKRVEYQAALEVGESIRRPWVGRLWAQARVAHLLEDLALDGRQAEKQKEVVELALAYNFVTQFTSFLAIPENEATGANKDALDSARARKQAVLEKHADATALDGDKRSSSVIATRSMESIDRSDDGDDDDDDGDYDSAESLGHPGAARKKSGCAGCASSNGGGGALLALLALGALFGRRRRRSAR